MSYDMQAEGNNGVSSQTNLGVLPGFTDLSVLNVDASVGARAAISAGCNGGNGVQGQSGSETDSGVWGDNTHGGFGVSGSTTGGLAGPGGPRGIVAGVWGSNSGQGAGVRGTNSNGDGVFGEGSVGVHGTSAVPAGGATAQGWGVWGEATATGGIGVNGTTLGVAVRQVSLVSVTTRADPLPVWWGPARYSAEYKATEYSAWARTVSMDNPVVRPIAECGAKTSLQATGSAARPIARHRKQVCGDTTLVADMV